MNPPAAKIVGLGAGGHAKVMLDLVASLPSAPMVAGLLDADAKRQGSQWGGVPILGGDSLLPQLRQQNITGFFLGLGSTGRLAAREALFRQALAAGLEPVSLIHPTAIISPSARLGRGVCVMPGAIINADVRIGDNVCINTGAIIEHDCLIADHVFVAPGAVLAGGVRVDSLAFIGLRSVIKQGLHVGSRALIGAGAVVLVDVAAETTVVGVPAKALLSHEKN